MGFCVFQAVKFSQSQETIDVRENDKDVQEINIHLAEVLRLIDPFDFEPAVHFAQQIDITNAWTSAEETVIWRSSLNVHISVEEVRFWHVSKAYLSVMGLRVRVRGKSPIGDQQIKRETYLNKNFKKKLKPRSFNSFALTETLRNI